MRFIARDNGHGLADARYLADYDRFRTKIGRPGTECRRPRMPTHRKLKEPTTLGLDRTPCIGLLLCDYGSLDTHIK
jgi:hypothetical protein